MSETGEHQPERGEEQESSFIAKTSTSSKSLNVKEVTDLLQCTPLMLRQFISVLPGRAVVFHPGAGKWCINEVVGHLTEEDKRDFVGRIAIMLHEANPLLNVNDQDQVARERHDCDKDIHALLDEFMAARAGSVEFVEQLGSEDLERRGMHPKIGPISVRELLHEWIYHDLNHARQIEANVQSFLWTYLGNMQQFYRS